MYPKLLNMAAALAYLTSEIISEQLHPINDCKNYTVKKNGVLQNAYIVVLIENGTSRVASVLGVSQWKV